MEREKKKAERRRKRKEQSHKINTFFPIDLLNDPQEFVDKLFSQLRKMTDRFEVKMAIMAVISRLLGRHKLILLGELNLLKNSNEILF